jgi:hypothetical protein
MAAANRAIQILVELNMPILPANRRGNTIAEIPWRHGSAAI